MVISFEDKKNNDREYQRMILHLWSDSSKAVLDCLEDKNEQALREVHEVLVKYKYIKA